MATPKSIGLYEIIREIGRGGMGVVYLARDPDIDRQVALKVLPADLIADEATRAKFEREINVFARLEHPHIVPTYGVGLSDRMPFLAMRYLSGGTLGDALDDDAFTDPKLWRAMHQVARALDYAHNEGLVHRDIKPSNILFDDAYNAFVADFGIAKLVNSASSLTTATTITGTPTYMSPEQFQKEKVDGRSDQYSLAVVLYEAIAGQTPFSGDTLQMMYQHVYEHPPAAHTIEKALSPALSLVLARALAKKPEDRYPTVEAFITDAERAATDPFVMPVAPVAALAPASALAVAPAAAAPQPAVMPQLVPGAGGTQTASRRSKRPLIAGLGVLALIVLAAYLLLWPQDMSATQTKEAPVVAIITPDEDAPGVIRRINVIALSPGSIWRNEAGEGQFDVGGVLEFSGQAPLNITTGGDKLSLALDDGTRLDIAAGSKLDIILVEAEGGPLARVILTDGILLATTEAAEPFDETGAPRAAGIEVANRPGARAILHSGMMGVTSSMAPLRFEADCLEGYCTLFGDLGGEVALIRGQHSVVGGNGWPSEPDAARYELFTALADFVATPTATTTTTATPTATRTPRLTRTPRSTLTPSSATSTRQQAALPTSTMTPMLVPTTTPIPGDTSPPRPNATNTSQPPATDTPRPYVPPATDTPMPYVPPATDTPIPYVPPPTNIPRPTNTPNSYPYP